VTAELRALAAETAIAAAALGRESRAHGTGTGGSGSALEHLLETSLDLGVYGPALEFFRALAGPLGDPCAGGAFAMVGSRTVCSVADASASLDSYDAAAHTDSAMHVGEWDLPYPVSAAAGHAAAAAVAGGEGKEGAGPSAVLVGVPGTRAYCDLHSSFVGMVNQVECHSVM
jgi:hypothetical protein